MSASPDDKDHVWYSILHPRNKLHHLQGPPSPCASDHRWVRAPAIVPWPLPLLNKSRLTGPPTPMMGTR